MWETSSTDRLLALSADERKVHILKAPTERVTAALLLIAKRPETPVLGNTMQHYRDFMDIFLETAKEDAHDIVLIFKKQNNKCNMQTYVCTLTPFSSQKERDEFYPAEAQE